MDDRTPCLARVISDTGASFLLGAALSSTWHFYKGATLLDRMNNIRTIVPHRAAIFAVWGGVYSSTDCCLASFRGKKDSWNSIVAGAATSGLLSFRQGSRRAMLATLAGGASITLLESLAMVMKGSGGLIGVDLPPPVDPIAAGSKKE